MTPKSSDGTIEFKRQALRARLLKAREQLADRALREQAMATHLTRWLSEQAPSCVGLYWPIKGEPDVRGAVGAWLAAAPGRSAALPVVQDDRLLFARWTPQTPVAPGRYGIPVPQALQWVVPDCLLVPCVGVDAGRFRLGYGAGFYDRTLADWGGARPRTVGIAFDASRVEDIGPQPHDVALDAVLTESGLR